VNILERFSKPILCGAGGALASGAEAVGGMAGEYGL